VPTVQLSLVAGLDPEVHLAFGRALAPLRDEGVLILGRGMRSHDLRAFGPRGRETSEMFDAWLRESVVLEPRERDRRLAAWESAPRARAAHLREEHLLPLMGVAEAGGDDRGEVGWSGRFVGTCPSAFHFGAGG